MKNTKNWLGLLMALIILSATLVPAGVLYTEKLSDQALRVVLDNGFEAILMPSRSAPVIAAIVIVQTGLRSETSANNGVSHCLEHMLFNGTRTRSQEQIYDAIDRIGAYNNASTSEDYTNYMVMAAPEHIDSALAIQSDMLFNSVFPEEKLEKERGIIIEEMAGNLSQPGYLAEQFYRHNTFGRTPYAMPVLGTVATIKNLSRQQILAFYQRHYVPNNMRGLFIGDFDLNPMIEKIAAKFGQPVPGDLSPAQPIQMQWPEQTTVTRTTLRTQSTFIQLLLRAPHFTDPDFYPFWLLAELMNTEGAEGLENAVNIGPMPTVFQIGASLEYHPDFTVLNISAVASPKANPDQILTRIEAYLKTGLRRPIAPERLETLRRQMLTTDAADFERPQHFGIVKSQQIAVGGFRFFTEFNNRMARVQPQDLVRMANQYLSAPVYLATIAEPMKESAKDQETVAGGIEKKVFNNGLTAIVQQSTGSDLFALHILVKNRLALEPSGRSGIAEFLQRMLLTGSQKYPKAALTAELERIGARVKLTDDPRMPFDDYYFSPEYAYIRLECLNAFSDAALTLLAQMVKQPALDEKEIEATRAELVTLVREKAESATEVAKTGFYQMVAPNTVLAGSIYGTETSINAITRADLVQFHRRFFAGNNLIVSVVSSQPVASVLAGLERAFGDLPTAADLVIVPLSLPLTQAQPKKVAAIGKRQSQLYLGYVVDGIPAASRPALLVANAYLSDQIQFELREKQGLAYSIGSTIGFYGARGIFSARIGTRPENLTQAETGILTEIRKLASKTFTEKEVQKTIQQILGSMRLRQLTRIGQAYYLGLGEFSEGDYNYHERLRTELQKLTTDMVQDASQQLAAESYVVSVAQ